MAPKKKIKKSILFSKTYKEGFFVFFPNLWHTPTFVPHVKNKLLFFMGHKSSKQS
jgi:hypothetical protein